MVFSYVRHVNESVRAASEAATSVSYHLTFKV